MRNNGDTEPHNLLLKLILTFLIIYFLCFLKFPITSPYIIRFNIHFINFTFYSEFSVFEIRGFETT